MIRHRFPFRVSWSPDMNVTAAKSFGGKNLNVFIEFESRKPIGSCAFLNYVVILIISKTELKFPRTFSPDLFMQSNNLRDNVI